MGQLVEWQPSMHEALDTAVPAVNPSPGYGGARQ